MSAKPENEREEIARIIADALGDSFDHACTDKAEWIDLRGMKGERFRDCNEATQGDYLDAADAILARQTGEPTLDQGHAFSEAYTASSGRAPCFASVMAGLRAAQTPLSQTGEPEPVAYYNPEHWRRVKPGGEGASTIYPHPAGTYRTPLYGRPPAPAEAQARVEALHPATRDLVDRFTTALAEKLAKAEAKYGYTDGWLSANWEADCREAFLGHIDKGDPRDVAAYCAFMWHHGWSTSSSAASDAYLLGAFPDQFIPADRADFVNSVAGDGLGIDGYVYYNPDAGLEWSENHPVESGEVFDAQDVRPATSAERAFYEGWVAEIAKSAALLSPSTPKPARVEITEPAKVQPPAKLTRAQRDMLERAVRAPDGRALGTYGVRQMAGGAKRRMFNAMQACGWFDRDGIITAHGRAALAQQGTET